MKKILILSTTLLLACSPWLHAEETGAGCGLGAVVLDGKSGKGSQIAAALLNNLVIPNTTFMTTGGGLMGCDPTQTVEKEQATEIFVASNMDQISSEAAKGSGEYLNVLAQLMGIEAGDMDSFQSVAQNNYDQLFGAGSDARSVIESIELAMLSDNNLAKYALN